jgi:hypothetical protein
MSSKLETRIYKIGDLEIPILEFITKSSDVAVQSSQPSWLVGMQIGFVATNNNVPKGGIFIIVLIIFHYYYYYYFFFF